MLFGEHIVYVATAFSGIGQSWVLGRHFPERGQWAIASALGWLVGGLLSEQVLEIFIPDISFTLNLFLFPIVAGAVMGIPLFFVIRRYLPNVGWWWIGVCAIGPAIQFPGMVIGGAIFWLMRVMAPRDSAHSERCTGPGSGLPPAATISVTNAPGQYPLRC